MTNSHCQALSTAMHVHVIGRIHSFRLPLMKYAPGWVAWKLLAPDGNAESASQKRPHPERSLAVEFSH